jgi:hypothetical protein
MNWGQHLPPVRRIQRGPGGDYATRAAGADWQASGPVGVSTIAAAVVAASCPGGIDAARHGQVERHIAGLNRGRKRPRAKQKAENQGKDLS